MLNIDYEMLRMQKADLLDVLGDNADITTSQRMSLEGIVSLIDGVQDDAVFSGELSEIEVFGILN